MSQRSYLLLSVDRFDVAFDKVRLVELIRSFEGISNVAEVVSRTPPFVRGFECKYNAPGERFTIRCMEGHLVSMDTFSAGTMSLAIRLQRLYGAEIYFMANDDVEGAVPLSEVANVDELRRRLSA